MSDTESQPSRYPPSGSKPPKQLRLWVMFLLTTLIAVAASGYSRGQTKGVWFALFSSWFIVLGLALVVDGVTSRSRERFFVLAIGMIMLVLGMLAFATFPYW